MVNILYGNNSIITARCPRCEKEVEALKLDNSNFVSVISNPPHQRQALILGCTECKNVFYKLEPE